MVRLGLILCTSRNFGSMPRCLRRSMAGWRSSIGSPIFDLETNLETTIRDVETHESLGGFLDETLHEWFAWLIPRVQWLQKRNASLETLAFPLTDTAAGQKELARAVYKVIRDKGGPLWRLRRGWGKRWRRCIRR